MAANCCGLNLSRFLRGFKTCTIHRVSPYLAGSHPQLVQEDNHQTYSKNKAKNPRDQSRNSSTPRRSLATKATPSRSAQGTAHAYGEGYLALYKIKEGFPLEPQLGGTPNHIGKMLLAEGLGRLLQVVLNVDYQLLKSPVQDDFFAPCRLL
jgi:hypothetical protein